MTLTLEDVRNKRFRNAGPDKIGYSTRDVDDFMDGIEDLVADLLETKEHLERQVDALRAEPGVNRIEVTTGSEASPSVVRLVEWANEQAERLVAEAQQEAARTTEEASRLASEVTTRAHERARQLEGDAASAAEQLTAEANARAEATNRDTESRRAEMQRALEQERDALGSTIDQLRAYETAYRNNLTEHLRHQLEALAATQIEPVDLPSPAFDRSVEVAEPAATDPAGRTGNADQGPAGQHDDSADAEPDHQTVSDTPRLDALIGEHR